MAHGRMRSRDAYGGYRERPMCEEAGAFARGDALMSSILFPCCYACLSVTACLGANEGLNWSGNADSIERKYMKFYKRL